MIRYVRGTLFTLCDLKVRDGLPFVHGDAPAVADSPAAEVYDQLGFIAVDCAQHFLQPFEIEAAGRK